MNWLWVKPEAIWLSKRLGLSPGNVWLWWTSWWTITSQKLVSLALKKKKINVGPPNPFVIFTSLSIIWKRDRFIRLIWRINTVRAPRDKPSDVIYYMLYQIWASPSCSEKAHGLQLLKAKRQLESAVHKESPHRCLELRWLFWPLCPDFADCKKKSWIFSLLKFKTESLGVLFWRKEPWKF